MPSVTPIAEDIGEPNGRKACAATPANSARASSVDQRRASSAAGSAEYSAEPGQLDRVLGHVQHRAHEVGGDVVEALGERSEHRLPRAGRHVRGPSAVSSHRLVGRGAGAAVERVGVLNLRPAPRQPVRGEVEAAGERRVDGQRVSGRALVVEQARERQLAGAGAASERVGRLEHGHLDAFGCEGEGGSEPVGPAADHDCGGHAVTA